VLAKKIAMATVVASLTAALPGGAQGRPEFPRETTNVLHDKVLNERIGEVLRVQVTHEVVGTIDVALGTTLIVLTSKAWRDEPRFAAVNAIGFGAIDAAALTSLFLTRDARSNILRTIVYAAPVVAGLSYTVAHDPYPFPRLTIGSATGGYLIASILGGLNAFGAPTPYSTLRKDQARLESIESLRSDERRAMHHDLMGARGPIPKWTIGAALLAGGAVALTPAFDDNYSRDEKTAAALVGGVSMLTGVLGLFNGPVERYEDDLKNLDISVAFTPTGLDVHGFFKAL
jgi:hypothetical protein